MAEVVEPFRTLYCDPGEDFGWCLGRGTKLLAAGTEKMWDFADVVWAALINQDPMEGYICAPDAGGFLRDEAQDERTLSDYDCRIERVVFENWRLYPNEMRGLAWSECRTARVIGAIQMMCRQADIECVSQPAAIKPAAQAAGVEEYYYEPLHENRHQNDAIQHWRFYTVTQLLGVYLPTADNKDKDGN
jgi:hypothetical protein